MPQSADSVSVTARFDKYAMLAEDIVLRGIEHPAFELKRAVTLSKSNLADRLDFVKFFQGLANSHKGQECLIIIGADQKERKFYEVDNVDDFDPARLSLIVAKYLSPEPVYEVFNEMRASTGERYVLIVLNQMQPRPIFALIQGESDARTHFRPGDIWIKHNTGLKAASRADLDLMYEPMIENEAAKRARIIFEQLKHDLGPERLSQAVLSSPVPELLSGSREGLKRYIEARLAANDIVPFKMLIEMARNTIVERWEKLNTGTYSAFGVIDMEHEAYLSSYSTEYLPIVQSVVDIGLVLIMYEAPLVWLKHVVDLLVQAFASSSHIERLVAFRDAENRRQAQPYAYPERAEGVQITPLAVGKLAYEVYLGARVLATYATMRKRPEHLGILMSKYVPILSEDRHREAIVPMLFWPFSGDLGLPQMLNGRNEDYWQERVGPSWPELFGSKDGFLSAASGLELILEMNSHIFVHDTYPELEQYKAAHPKQQYTYLPDFWRTRLNPAMPTAEWVFDRLMNEKRFPGVITSEPDLIQKIFANKTKDDRARFFGEFLVQLRKWHGEALMQQQRIPYNFAWPEILQMAVDAYKASLRPNA